MPSDSNFAVAMRTQQQAERAEQQRIKNLVLNYDLTDDPHDGEAHSFHYVMSPTSKRTRLVGKGVLNRSLYTPPIYTQRGPTQRSTSTVTDGKEEEMNITRGPLHFVDVNRGKLKQQDSLTDISGSSFDTLHGPPRADKSGTTRSKQRARKLQLGDLDWYGNRSSTSAVVSSATPPAVQSSLDDYVVDKKAKRASTLVGGRRVVKDETRSQG